MEVFEEAHLLSDDSVASAGPPSADEGDEEAARDEVPVPGAVPARRVADAARERVRPISPLQAAAFAIITRQHPSTPHA